MMAVLSLLSYYIVESRPANLSVARPNLLIEKPIVCFMGKRTFRAEESILGWRWG